MFCASHRNPVPGALSVSRAEPEGYEERCVGWAVHSPVAEEKGSEVALGQAHMLVGCLSCRWGRR